MAGGLFKIKGQGQSNKTELKLKKFDSHTLLKIFFAVNDCGTRSELQISRMWQKYDSHRKIIKHLDSDPKI